MAQDRGIWEHSEKEKRAQNRLSFLLTQRTTFSIILFRIEIMLCAYLISLALFFTSTTSLPLADVLVGQLIARASPRYSVVNVDGGSSQAPIPTTVIHTIKQSVTKTADTVPTMVMNEPPATTIIIPPMSTVTLPATTVVIVETQSPGTTEYYDDGLWHTYYAKKTWTTELVGSPTITAASYATSSSSQYSTATP
ncbi:hypothetical protein M501DRAFT_985950 [Patellaria atrata CBS 101060]|uniref:Uncharacterized protein n=1 Tax=Patellaria atrata CBS 101060 TaxID=1346257 RepID=A0A9P4VPW5_9PEZI|nr:hypothetical protein M501DRAFT_985950 [Patellaria atrata CBS 101060]